MVRTLYFITILLYSLQAWTQSPNTTIARANQDSLYWIQIATDSGVIHAAVVTPKGPGPFPAVILLHGTHGFAQEYINIARRLADNGIIGIAACWFTGRKGAGQRFITPINFNDAPPLVDAPGLDRFRIARLTIDTLLVEVKKLSQVQKNHIALFGHSRGGGAALNYAFTHPGKVQALILNSTGYPPEVIQRASGLDVPILIIHGTVNDPADGGSALANIEMAKQFEDALKSAKKNVEAKYYEGSGHNTLFSNADQFNDTVRQILQFLKKKLSK
ncbi:MAG TPA: alpha/beta fold hydrolase [Chitinophagaceae bacterium]|nr:alpha/beta fold hydrolase [Chitinophagaceae bacterium]